MRTPVERLRLGGIILAAIIITAILGYRFLGGYEWTEAI